MRFISHIRRLSVGIQSGRNRYELGMEQVVVPNIVAEFWQGDITSAELAFAEFAFKGELNGRTLELDEVTPTQLLGRLSIYDTENPSVVAAMEALDEEFGKPRGHESYKDLLEAKLLSRSGPGLDFRLVEEAPVPAPWPRYNEYAGSFEDLVQRVIDDGYHLPEVLAYERQNLNRVEVVELLEMSIRDNQASSADFVQA